MIKAVLQLIGIPILFVLYLLPIPFLLIRDSCQYVLLLLDSAFNKVCFLINIDHRFLPLPKASNQRLPYE